MQRRQFLEGALSLLATGAAHPVLAQTPAAPAAPADSYRPLFDAAVAQHRFDSAILVVRHGGRTVAAHGHKANAAAPSLIGSMSKPITAVAVATLIRDGRLTFATPMRDALAGFFKRHGRPADTRFMNVTIEQLLVHRSGMAGNPDGDPVHKARQDRAMRGEGDTDAPQAVLAELLKQPLKREPGMQASYSGGGYFALAAVIEEATGKSYETFCRDAVFAKLGIARAQLHPDWRVLGAAGGWFIPGGEYLRFLEIFDPAHPFLGDAVKTWIDQAQTRWDSGNRGGWTSLAVNTSAHAGRWRVSHGGGLNSHAKDRRGRPTHAVIESIGYRMANTTSVFLAITPAVAGGHPGFRSLLADVERAHAAIRVQ